MSTHDFHIHTTQSDGLLHLDDVIKYSKELGLKYIAITDHDKLLTRAKAKRLSKKYNITVIGGSCEFSAKYRYNGKLIDLHILAYGVKSTRKIKEFLKIGEQGRIISALGPNLDGKGGVIELLQKRGYKITVKDVFKRMEKAGSGFTTNFISDILLENNINNPLVKDEIEFVKKDAKKRNIEPRKRFCEYWKNEGQSYYVPRYIIEAHDLINAIHNADGIAILAHPDGESTGNIRKIKDPERIISDLTKTGLDGIECYHSEHDRFEMVEFYLRLAKKYKLFVTLGSDYHGEEKLPHYLGKGKNENLLQAEIKHTESFLQKVLNIIK